MKRLPTGERELGHPKSRVSILLSVVVASISASAMVAAVPRQEQGACLGNNNAYSVPVGAQYSDEQGLWTCNPDAEDATAGGWVLVPAPAPTVMPTVPPSFVPRAAAGEFSGPVPNNTSRTAPVFVWVAGAGAVIGIAAIAAVVVIRRISGSPLAGTINVKEVRRG